jgi:hypothetical protein
MGIFARPHATHILDSARVIETIERLKARVSERFPDSGLSKVCADLAVTARATAQRAHALHKPNVVLRFLAAIVVLAGIAA